MKKSIQIFCDSSYNQRTKTAGWGVVVKDGIKERSYSGWLPAENNNFGEMFAIHTACVLLGGEKGVIYSDSQTAIDYINDNINDKIRTPEQYRNHQRMRLWAYKIRKFNIEIRKVKAHQQNYKYLSIQNNKADLCAKEGLSKYFLTLSKERVR